MKTFKLLESRVDALFWSFTWVMVVWIVTGIGYFCKVFFGVGDIHIDVSILLSILLFLVSYVSCRKGEL
jgi:CDP-diglyceride synthetase